VRCPMQQRTGLRDNDRHCSVKALWLSSSLTLADLEVLVV
jgi:hypothetical protein